MAGAAVRNGGTGPACPSCGTVHPSSANFCMHCGRGLRLPPADGAGGVGVEEPRGNDGTAGQRVAQMPPGPAGSEPGQWEYREVTVPLHLTRAQLAGASLAERYSQIVGLHLHRHAQDGWQPDSPTDLQTMAAAGRVVRRYQTGTAGGTFGTLGGWPVAYDSVTLRLKRWRRG